ncbi:Uncharacterised protein [Mycobacteroides abscessus subsp. massiliense]|uniref:hypothetical protein n=1 Tax=Mycobacteroides abscessus TaxID=36809 RepID=UPI0009A59B75|nr:hypothetical protein [Mycobacteroides abscessus]SLE66981.1 Uncharacterised protein [Mycobacteroides abscessus subsp. massiliense]
MITADGALGIVFGLAVEFLRGAAASTAVVCQRLAEQRCRPMESEISSADLESHVYSSLAGPGGLSSSVAEAFAECVAADLRDEYRITKK